MILPHIRDISHTSLLSILICILGIIGIATPHFSVFTAIAGVCCTLWIPGYAIITLLKPKIVPNEKIIVIAGSVLISITLVSLSSVLLDLAGIPSYLGPPYQTHPQFTSLILVYSAGLSIISVKAGQSRQNNGLPDYSMNDVNLHQHSMTFTTSLLILFVSVGAALFILPYTNPMPQTELFLINNYGEADHYQVLFNSSENLSLMIGVTNYEGQDENFLLRIYYNEKELQREELGIPNGEQYLVPILINADQLAPWNSSILSFNLYTDNSTSALPYRRVSIPVRVHD